METNIIYSVFHGEDLISDDALSGRIDNLCKKIDTDYEQIAMEALRTGHLVVSMDNPQKIYMDISKFLDEDKAINLPKLELGILISCKLLETFDVPFIEIDITGIAEYAELRGIGGNTEQISEELKFINHFLESVLESEYTVSIELIRSSQPYDETTTI